MDKRHAAARAGRAANGGSFIVLAAFLFLTATCAAAIHRALAADDIASMVFIAVSYGALLLLHRTLRSYDETAAAAAELEQEPEDEDGAAAAADADAETERERLRRRVWVLCTLISVMFAWKVAGVVPWPAGVLVCAAAAVTSAGGLLALVLPRRRARE